MAAELAEYLSRHPGTQRELAEKAKVSQSTVSRAQNYSGRSRPSKGLLALCKYAGIETHLIKPESIPDPRKNTVLMEALENVWDGTDKSAKALAKVILDIKSWHLKTDEC